MSEPHSKPHALGANTFGLFWSHSATSAISDLAALGYDHFDLICAPPHLDLLKYRRNGLAGLQDVLVQTGTRVTSLNVPSLDQNLASPCDGMLDFSARLYEEAILLASELGATSVAILSGRKHALSAGPKDQLLASYTKSVDRLLNAAERAGVRLVVENHPLGLLDSADTIEAFLDRYDGRLGLLYDVANAVAIDEDPARGIRQLARFIGMIHLSDSPKGEWRHNPIGDGTIDFAAIGSALTEIGYAGEIVLELMGDDALAAFKAAPERLRLSGFPA